MIFGIVFALAGMAMLLFPRRVQAFLKSDSWSRVFYENRFFVPICMTVGAAMLCSGIYIFQLK